MTGGGPLWTAVTPGFNWMSPLPALPGYPCWTTTGGLNTFPTSVWNPSLAVGPSFPRANIPSGQSQATGVIQSPLTQVTPPVAAAVTLSSIPLLNSLNAETAQEVTSFGNTHRLLTFPAFNDLQSPVSMPMTGQASSRVSTQTHTFHPYRRV